MNRRFLGWLPTSAIFVIIGIAFFLGAWKTALILLAPALVSMPIRWGIPHLHFLSSESMERGAMCLILAVLGTVALGLETSSRESPVEVTKKKQESSRRSSGSDDDSGTIYAAAPPVTPEVRAQTVRRAIDHAKSCDGAHSRAAGAVRQISTGQPTREIRAAVAAAVESCETSWILFNRPELRDNQASQSDSANPDEMEACDEGYLGRWLANDNLLAALDKGLPGQDVGRIERMNSANDRAVTACTDMLQKYGAKTS